MNTRTVTLLDVYNKLESLEYRIEAIGDNIIRETRNSESIRHYTVSEVAKMLSCSIHTVRRKIKSGKLKAQFAGRSYAIPRAELLRYINKHVNDRHKTTITV